MGMSEELKTGGGVVNQRSVEIVMMSLSRIIGKNEYWQRISAQKIN